MCVEHPSPQIWEFPEKEPSVQIWELPEAVCVVVKGSNLAAAGGVPYVFFSRLEF